MKAFQLIYKILLITAILMYIPSLAFAQGSKEGKNKDAPQENGEGDAAAEVQEEEIIVENSLEYSTIVSNNGILYIFKETTDLPPDAILGQLNIQDVNSKNPHIKNFSTPIQSSSEKYEYILTATPNTFYPLVPFVAILTLIDQDSKPIRTSETNFITDFSLHQASIIEPSLYRSEPILFTRDFIEVSEIEAALNITKPQNNTTQQSTTTTAAVKTKVKASATTPNQVTQTTELQLFSDIYRQEDRSLIQTFSQQIIDAIKKYPDDSGSKYVLITGYNVNSDFSAEAYKRLLNKANILRQALIQYNQEQESSLSIFVSTDVLLQTKKSNGYKTNLYPQNDQAFINITNQEDVIQRVKKEHQEQTIQFYKEASGILYAKYRVIQERIETIKSNFLITQQEYLDSETYLKLSTADSTLNKSEYLEEKMGSWINKTDEIKRSLKRVREQLSALNRSKSDDKSLNSVMDMMNHNGINDPTLLNGLVTLQAGYDDTYTRISEIEDEYTRRSNIVEINRSSNLAYISMLREFLILLEYQEKIINEENNQFMLNNFSVLLADIEGIYSNIPKILENNINNDTIEIPALISGIQKVEALLTQLENRIIEVSNMLAQRSSAANKNILTYNQQKDEVTDSTHGDAIQKTETLAESLIIGSSLTNIRDENDYIDPQINIIPIEKGTYSLNENIQNGISNIIAVSEQLKLRNSISKKILNINQATDSIQVHYYLIQAKVYPIIHASDNELMTKTINNKDVLSAPNIAPNIAPRISPTIVKPQAKKEETKVIPQPRVNKEKILFEELPQNSIFTIPLETKVVGAFDEDKMALQEIFTAKPKPVAVQEEKKEAPTPTPATAVANIPVTPKVHPHSVISQGSISKQKIIAYIYSKQNNPVTNINELIDYYIMEASREGINSDIAIAQMLYNTRFVGVKKFFGKNNPIGIGGPSRNNWEIYPFASIQLGVRAHIQHLKAYSSTSPINNTIVDPRYNILKENQLIGSAQTIEDISYKWYGSNKAANSIISILNEMKAY